MNMPGFSAEASLYQSRGYFFRRRTADSHADSVVPAIPFCGNCDFISITANGMAGAPGRYVRPVRPGTVLAE